MKQRSRTVLSRIPRLVCLGIGISLATFAPGWSEAEDIDLEALKASLKSAEEAFAQSVTDGDIQAFASHIAEDAVFSGSGESLVGREAIVKAWAIFFEPDGPKISWHPEKVALVPDGGLGTSQGPYQVESRSGDGEIKLAAGTFFSVWRQTHDGWRIILDSGTQAKPKKPAKTWEGAFEGLEWIEGRWTGEGLGGWVEEVWSAPEGGAMVGHFRLVTDGKTSFYELFTLREEAGQLVLRLKHFEPDMKGWEEKEETVSFPLQERGEGFLKLEGLRYTRDGDEGLHVEVDLHRKEGIATESFTFRRSEL